MSLEPFHAWIYHLPSSSTTNRELLPQFSTCIGWRWLDVVWKIKENCHVLVNQFHGNFRSKTLGCRGIKSVFRDVKWCFNASWGLKGLNCIVRLVVVQWLTLTCAGNRAYSTTRSMLLCNNLERQPSAGSTNSIMWVKRWIGRPTNTRRWSNVVLMLRRRRRRWANIKITLAQWLVFAEIPTCIQCCSPLQVLGYFN